MVSSEPDKRWLALNLKAPEMLPEKEEFLVKVFHNLISAAKREVESWHFLWESKPFKHTLLLRFYGKADTIEEIRNLISRRIKEIEINSDSIEFDEDYVGEASEYGLKGSDYMTEILNLGSNLAIDLIRIARGEKIEEIKGSLERYIERWTHLFLNQSLTQVNEAYMLFCLSIHRYAINRLDEEKYKEIDQALNKELPILFRQAIDEVTKRLNLPN